jgi:hypothetical protein
MIKRTLMLCLIAAGLLGSLEILARRAGAQPGDLDDPILAGNEGDGPGRGSEGRHGRHGRGSEVDITDEQEQELLAALKRHDSRWHERLLRVKAEHPRRYRFFLARAWDWYEKIRNMPADLQETLKQIREDRLTSWQLVQRYRAAETSDQRQRARKQLAETIGRLLDAEQKLTAYRIAKLEEQIAQIKARMQAQASRREELIEERIEQLLESPDSARPRPPGMPRHRRGR